ncbi:MAG TPA: RNA-binding domain-containing protein [Candidatus Thermoplasmatota archaeon]|nr:RNA-binding domain-containing protein [Candidatus Thermoplasmatota archaeon]
MALFHYVHFRAFAHETEDEGKVRAALLHAAQDARASVQETRVDGSHGNRILILETDVRSGAAEKHVFSALARDDPGGFERVARTLRERVDENLSFHLRLDKQEAFGGRSVLATDDDAITVRGKIRLFGSKRSTDGLERSLQQLEAFFLGVGSPSASRTVKREHSSHVEQSE